jgi:hypothetical protein
MADAGELVLVRWHDAGSAETAEEAAAIVRESVGFFVRRNRAGLWLSMERDQLSQVHFIPRGMILAVSRFDAPAAKKCLTPAIAHD